MTLLQARKAWVTAHELGGLSHWIALAMQHMYKRRLRKSPTHTGVESLSIGLFLCTFLKTKKKKNLKTGKFQHGT